MVVRITLRELLTGTVLILLAVKGNCVVWKVVMVRKVLFRLNERRYDTSSPSFAKKTSESAYNTSKMSSMRISGSPNLVERSSPDVGHSTRYIDKRYNDSRSFYTEGLRYITLTVEVICKYCK